MFRVAVVFEPPLVGLGAQRPDEPETARRIREDADHACAALDLLVEPFEQVRCCYLSAHRPYPPPMISASTPAVKRGGYTSERAPDPQDTGSTKSNDTTCSMHLQVDQPARTDGTPRRAPRGHHRQASSVNRTQCRVPAAWRIAGSSPRRLRARRRLTPRPHVVAGARGTACARAQHPGRPGEDFGHVGHDDVPPFAPRVHEEAEHLAGCVASHRR